MNLQDSKCSEMRKNNQSKIKMHHTHKKEKGFSNISIYSCARSSFQ